MYLKRLEILGFKSFANKTTVKFSNGITAIVGPNGCGKTNILDALRWVLGEQKVSLLRGSKMEEIIFNGTRDLKPLGMSEVTLSLVNDRGVLPTEYTEVQITRRLFRSGESEYLLNKIPCRLKDITELFFDTGLGPHSYSVIQQDMIDAVISDKAEERRFLFEEAAGITKYKQRKKAAMRKLEATEQDLLRLRDIHSEVKTRVNSLNRQYKKAERYQLIKEDIKNWEIYLSGKQIRTIEQERREIRSKIDELSNIIVDRDTGINRLSAELEAERKSQIDLEHELNEISSTVYSITEQAHDIEKQISINQEKSANSKSLIERDTNDIEALVNRSKILKEQITESHTENEKNQQEYSGIITQLRDAELKQDEADKKLLLSRNQKDTENQKLIELEGKISSGITEDDGLKKQEDEFNTQIESLNVQLSENTTSQLDLRSKQDESKQSLSKKNAVKYKAEETRQTLTVELESLVEQNEELNEEISSLSASIEACQARKDLLEEMILQFEGYESGLVAAMEVKERWPGIAGTVADNFVPVEGMEVALEAALGEISGFMICKERTTAEQIVSYLKAEKKGKIGILVEDSGTLNPLVKRPELDMPEFIGWLDNFVSTEENLKHMKQAVLSHIAVFKEGHSPQEILTHLPYGFKAVSTCGDVYSRNVITGGSDDSLPLFRRKEKVADEQQMIEDITVKLEHSREEKNRVNARIAEARAESAEVVQRIESITEEINANQKEHDNISYNLRTAETESQRIQKEIQFQKGRVEKIKSRQYSLGLDFDQLKDLKENLLNNMTQAGEQLDSLENNAHNSSSLVSSLQIKIVETQSKIDQIENKITHQQELQADIANTIRTKQEEIERAHTEARSAVEKNHTLEIELKSVFEKREVLTNGQTELKTKQSDIQQHASAKEDTLKRLRSEKDESSNKHHEFDIRLNTIESEVNVTAEKIQEEYELDIRSLETACPNEEMSDVEARTHLNDQKEKLRKFGAVNLLALEEYDEAAEREKFLDEHLTDLTTAKNDLETTIGKINITARQLFIETFAKVQENFKKLFIELFSGGEASLKLEDPNNPLESNIEIIARPRGKKLLSITMLSGGERALTAISLLFSLYLVKPSPYCILDEIDAPLDDANCHRFLKMIASFSGQTQFITITHNKITMEAANNLYGVTMEQPGISKLVGVKFNEAPADQDSVEIVITSDRSDDENESMKISSTPDEIELPDAVVSRISSNINTGDDELPEQN